MVHFALVLSQLHRKIAERRQDRSFTQGGKNLQMTICRLRRLKRSLRRHYGVQACVNHILIWGFIDTGACSSAISTTFYRKI